MKARDWMWMGLICGWVACANAQIQVDLATDQDQFLPGEALMIAVKIKNLSGQDLQPGGESDWLRFNIESREGLPLQKTSEVNVTGEFSVHSSEVATKVVDLAPCYALILPGKYRVTATVYVSSWKQEFVSKTKVVDIVSGTKLWQQEFGVPLATNQTAKPEVRKYALQKAIYLRQLKLYLRLTNPADTQVFRVFPLGNMVSFSRPEAQIDRNSNLHVLCQSGAKSFFYSVVDPNGRQLLHQTYSYYGNSRPALRTTSEGIIGVTGGIRTPDSDDFPAESASVTNAIPSLTPLPPPPPPWTNAPSASTEKKPKKSKKPKKN